MSERALSVVQATDTSIIDEVVIKGDLGKLSPEQRAEYYVNVCRSLGLNPMTQPFQYITLNGKLTLYAARSATDQLRKIHGVSLDILSAETTTDGVYVVTVRATDASGRHDTEIGAVAIKGLTGEALANALMKGMTKAKRRATLSIVGLGWLDETEIETIPSARPTRVDITTGEISPPAPIKQLTGGEPATRDNKLARLHAIGADRGLDHDGLHRVMRFALPSFGSLSELGSQQVDYLCNEIETAADDDIAAWETDWEGEITGAMTPDTLAAVAHEMVRVGITRDTHKHLISQLNQRKLALRKSAAPEPVADAEQGTLDDMPVDADRYTA